MASSQEDATDSEVSSKETPMGSTPGLLPEVGLKIPLSEVDMSLLQSPKTQTVSTQILMKTAKTRTHPTAAINKNRAPQGDVNLERSLEIVRSAVEKSVIKNTTVVVQAVPAPGAAPVSGKEFCTTFYFAFTWGLLALSLIYKKRCHTGGRHLVDIIGDISWTKEVTFLGHFCPREVLFLGDISWTFLGDFSWTFFG